MLFDQRVVHRRASDLDDPDGVIHVQGVDEHKGTMDRELLLACSCISGRCCDGQEKDGWVCLPTLGSG